MDTDERFKHLASDPRFKTLRKKQRKVQIDERFQSMFTDERFTLKYSKDKRGRNQKKTSGDDLKRYYSLKEDESKTGSADKEDKFDAKIKDNGAVNDEKREEEEDDDDDEDVDDDKDTDDDDGKDVKDKQVKEIEDEDADSEKNDLVASEEEESDIASEIEDESESELSTSSDEPESDIDGYDSDGQDLDVNNINYDWQPLDADAEKADTTSCRLAIQNLDWDHLDVRDIYILVNSIRPPMSVKVYVSEFGKERLAKEDLEGPQELIERSQDDEDEEELKQLESKMKTLQEQNTLGKKYRNYEYEDADEALDPKNEEIREKIRRYQLSRMKYYYAVVEFDSIESAEAVYKELDGMEYEGSSLELDLRFVPDDIEFDSADLKAECSKIPDPTSYKAPHFINSALQQTTVKFTWDETDIKRQEKLQRAYTKEELDKDDLEAYLATESEDEDDDDEEDDEHGFQEGGIDRSDTVSVVTANSEARINKYKMLLKSLEAEEDKKKKVDVDVEWGNFDEDEEAAMQDPTGEEEDDEEEEEEDHDDGDDESNDYVDYDDNDEDEDKNARGKKEKKKKKKKHQRKKDGAANGGGGDDDDDDLDLLVLDVDGRRENEFKFNPDDERFKAIYESGLYNIDPSHPNFKRTKAFEQMAEKKREKRRKTGS